MTSIASVATIGSIKFFREDAKLKSNNLSLKCFLVRSINIAKSLDLSFKFRPRESLSAQHLTSLGNLANLAYCWARAL